MTYHKGGLSCGVGVGAGWGTGTVCKDGVCVSGTGWFVGAGEICGAGVPIGGTYCGWVAGCGAMCGTICGKVTECTKIEGDCHLGDTSIWGSCGTKCGDQVWLCDTGCVWRRYGCINEGECSAGAVGNCGSFNCGQKTCQSNCQWSNSCDLKLGNDCFSGDTGVYGSCTKCGDQTYKCIGCKWQPDQCVNQGECSPGQKQTDSCGFCGTHSRTCTAGCSWPAAWGSCINPGNCWPGDTRNCGANGTEVCTGSCSWSGNCVENCVCSGWVNDGCNKDECSGTGLMHQTQSCNGSAGAHCLPESQCASDASCTPPIPTHLECNVANQCVSVSGAGANQCANNSDCGAVPPTHLECNVANQCVSVAGAGANQCVSDTDCGNGDGGDENWWELLPWF